MKKYIKALICIILASFCLASCVRGEGEADKSVKNTAGATTESTGDQTDIPIEVHTETESMPQAVPQTETQTEITTEPATEAVTEPITEPVTEVVTEPWTEPVTEPWTEPVTEEVTELVTEAVPEPAPSQGEPTYINGILIANKTYGLPADYAPGADPEATNMLYEMFAAASTEGLSLWVRSGYRSYNDQLWQYNVYAQRDGVALADTYSARAGHSEHQTGLAFDLNSLYKSFGQTPEGLWLAANCHRFGFIIRYPEDKEHITGYMYEPWHVRYLGVDVATAVYESGLCLEEYLGITSQYQY